MNKSGIARQLAAVLFLCTAAGQLRADDQVHWRFWGVRDDFVETYTNRVSVTPNGSVYARHGAVRAMSVFDGYKVTRIPEPRRTVQAYLPGETRACTPAPAAIHG